MAEGNERVDRAAFEDRTKQFALRVMRLCRALRGDDVARALARQLVRSGMSVGANYRAAGRARSKAEFLSKLGTVEEEADETCLLLARAGDSGRAD